MDAPGPSTDLSLYSSLNSRPPNSSFAVDLVSFTDFVKAGASNAPVGRLGNPWGLIPLYLSC